MKKYNIGCGATNFGSTWIHVDRDKFEHVSHNDVTLSFLEEKTADIIYCSHFLEYFDKTEVMKLLLDWHRALKDGGELFVCVPDFSEIVKIYTEQAIILDGALYGKMGGPSIYHKSVFDRKTLREALLLAGFRNVSAFDPMYDDCSKDKISLNLKCRK